MNFWQIVGITLLVIGLVGVLYNRVGPESPPVVAPVSDPVTTQPATQPAAP
ncbi:MAG TPA: hypothetical protein VF624_09220 [Tepidisphaeraceae bacterium]